MQTTLNLIRAHSPCRTGWEKLLAHLGKTKADDAPLHLRTVLDSNGLDDTLWCLRAVAGETCVTRLYVVWCARQVQHLVVDPRSVAALDVAERHARGEATDGELTAAWAAAEDARAAAWAAAEDARAAARAAAWAAAEDARAAAARAAAEDARAAAARAAAWAAAEDARAAAADARAAARAAQETELRRVFDCMDAGRDPYPR